MADEKPRLRVVAGIIWRDEKFLAADRPVGSYMEGYWEFPGGKIDGAETAEQALVRELQEELNITIVEPRLWKKLSHEYEKHYVDLQFFHICQFEGEPIGAEGQSIAWVTPHESLAYKFLPVDIALLHELATLTPCEK